MNTKVSQMTSPRSGREVANQFIIKTREGEYFQSYNSVIAFKPSYETDCKPIVYLDKEYWNYSVTTSKYRNKFLGVSTRETEQKIADGTYILTNLN